MDSCSTRPYGRSAKICISHYVLTPYQEEPKAGSQEMARQEFLPQTKLLKNSKELNIWSHYLARAFVGRMISAAKD
jgi:hypothetical protein